MPYLSASEVMIHEEALYEVCYLYLCLQITPTWQNARPNRMREGKFFYKRSSALSLSDKELISGESLISAAERRFTASIQGAVVVYQRIQRDWWWSTVTKFPTGHVVAMGTSPYREMSSDVARHFGH